jgi:competence protein ComEC
MQLCRRLLKQSQRQPAFTRARQRVLRHPGQQRFLRLEQRRRRGDVLPRAGRQVLQQRQEPVRPEPGSTAMLGGAKVTVLGPVKDDYDTNNSSIVLRVDYGATSFLFTGDAETTAEKDILEAGYDVSATVLKVGHHGSDTSSSYQWLREVAAKYAVIQVGEGNTYDHPHELILSRLRDADMTVYRTDLQGHIVCHSDGQTVRFETDKSAPVTNPTKEPDLFVGNKNSKVLHLETCSGLPKEENRVMFESYDAAMDEGYTPCSRCMG